MRNSLFTCALALAVGLLPVRAFGQEEEEEDEENSSFEQSTEDSSDETTQESTNQPSRNTTDPTVELLGPLLEGGREPTEAEGDYTDSDRAAALGISALALTLVIVAVVSVASGDPKPASAIVSPHEQKAALWLRENDEQLRIDLARGEGPTIDDLAAAFRVEAARREALGAALRRRRSALLATLDESIAGTMRVRGFLREVSATMRDDEALRVDWERWRMTYGIASP